MGQTCTLCTWCTIHTGDHAHVVVRHPSCVMTDDQHVPKPPRCLCIMVEAPPPPTLLHNPNCPSHP